MKKQEHSHPMCNNVLHGILHHTGIGTTIVIAPEFIERGVQVRDTQKLKDQAKQERGAQHTSRPLKTLLQVK